MPGAAPATVTVLLAPPPSVPPAGCSRWGPCASRRLLPPTVWEGQDSLHTQELPGRALRPRPPHGASGPAPGSSATLAQPGPDRQAALTQDPVPGPAHCSGWRPSPPGPRLRVGAPGWAEHRDEEDRAPRGAHSLSRSGCPADEGDSVPGLCLLSPPTSRLSCSTPLVTPSQGPREGAPS